MTDHPASSRRPPTVPAFDRAENIAVMVKDVEAGRVLLNRAVAQSTGMIREIYADHMFPLAPKGPGAAMKELRR